jgi:hypothetical protein
MNLTKTVQIAAFALIAVSSVALGAAAERH